MAQRELYSWPSDAYEVNIEFFTPCLTDDVFLRRRCVGYRKHDAKQQVLKAGLGQQLFLPDWGTDQQILDRVLFPSIGLLPPPDLDDADTLQADCPMRQLLEQSGMNLPPEKIWARPVCSCQKSLRVPPRYQGQQSGGGNGEKARI